MKGQAWIRVWLTIFMAADGEILTFLKYFGLGLAAGMGMVWHGMAWDGGEHDLASTIYIPTAVEHPPSTVLIVRSSYWE